MKLKVKKPSATSIIGSYLKNHNYSISRSNSPYRRSSLNKSDYKEKFIKDDIAYLKKEIKKIGRRKVEMEISCEREVKKKNQIIINKLSKSLEKLNNFKLYVRKLKKRT